MRKQINNKVRTEIFKKANYRCYYCWINLKNLGRNATIDHLIQIYVGGTNQTENLVACCRRCNSARGGLTVAEFSVKRQEERTKRMRKLGKKGGQKTAEKGSEYFSRISRRNEPKNKVQME